MTAPLSPDEGVRAALEAARQFITNGIELGFIRMPDPSTPDPAHGTLGKIEAALAALSTPVPEEGLPRGSASAAEGGWRPRVKALEWRAPYGPTDTNLADSLFGIWSVWEIGGCGYFRAPDAYGGKPVNGGMDEAKAAAQAEFAERVCSALDLSAEAGAGVASALPSPLPSQGEPVAKPIGYTNSDELADIAADMSGLFWAKKGWSAGIPLYTAEALAAERARADSLKRELEEWKGEAASHMRSAADLIKERAAAEARADRAVEALKPFAEAANGFDYGAKKGVPDRFHILAGLTVGDLRRARTILKETAHDER